MLLDTATDKNSVPPDLRAFTDKNVGATRLREQRFHSQAEIDRQVKNEGLGTRPSP